jgi:Tfp pilus assembly protein PilX
MTRRMRFHPIADERAQSLVMALLVMTFLAVSLGTVIFFTAGNQRTSNLQKAQQVATSLAEAGVNNAVSVLANPANSNSLETSWSMGTAVLPDGTASHPAYSTRYSGGAPTSGCVTTAPCVKWWGNLDTSLELWTLHSQATVPNPTGAAAIVKTMSAQVQVHPPNPNNLQLGVWNTIYSPFGPSSGCDTTVAQGVTMSVPLYVGGNLCLANSAIINAPVWVGGFFYANNKQASIGTSGTPVTSKLGTPGVTNPVHIGNYCQVQNGGTQVNPCVKEPANPSTNVFLTMSGAWNPRIAQASMPDFVNVTAPAICWNGAQAGCGANVPAGGWYTYASPGPLHNCDAATKTGTPPTFDTGDGIMNESVLGTFNLTPPTSYTCRTAQGELSWNAAARVLTVYGTVFIDGNVTASNSGSAPITYGGGSWSTCTTTLPCDGVIYVSGTVYITGEKLCAKANAANTDCDWTNWDPNKKILIFLAHDQGTQSGVSAGQGVVVGPSQTSFQGGLYADYQVNTGQGAATQGPLVSGTQTVVTGQQFQGSFPLINILPIPIQGPPQKFWIDPPMNFKYGG